MNLVQFKSNLFGGTWGLNTTEIAVLMFITLQDRARFVFYKNKMMQALNIRDIRTLNKALNSLTAKGIIKQTLASAKGILFSIIGLDKEEPAQEPEPEEMETRSVDSNLSEKMTGSADVPEAPEAPEECRRPFSPEPDPVTVEPPEGPNRGRNPPKRFEHLPDVSEMEQDKRDALAVLIGRFAT